MADIVKEGAVVATKKLEMTGIQRPKHDGELSRRLQNAMFVKKLTTLHVSMKFIRSDKGN